MPIQQSLSRRWLPGRRPVLRPSVGQLTHSAAIRMHDIDFIVTGAARRVVRRDVRVDQICFAAAKLDVEVERLEQWEQGTDLPSIAQLRKVGETYKRPLAVFFLSEPPQGFDPQREFRRLAGVTPQTESPELRLSLRVALFRREVARELY
ncbi:MAG: hypothetical protein HGB05_18105, partial [Chloroflexi bacterium]|nr:hypothetical protein [Chloroflexota bacterium]